ncbi:hypothetical protein GDO81_010784 [Engystomops pustulosus]|uniref:Uncharacterized protein n=1 Tax=Engystomops pustulosus TaxID=76066 RepID=A0AAV7C2S7_ENGPU|nr:hypothetical protein GDO81_010784 [Engystomops pustulosus]
MWDSVENFKAGIVAETWIRGAGRAIKSRLPSYAILAAYSTTLLWIFLMRGCWHRVHKMTLHKTSDVFWLMADSGLRRLK